MALQVLQFLDGNKENNMKLYDLLAVLDPTFEEKIVLVKDDETTETTTKRLSYKFLRDEIVYVRQDYQEKQVIIKLKGE
jgi:precorrin-2 methylase